MDYGSYVPTAGSSSSARGRGRSHYTLGEFYALVQSRPEPEKVEARYVEARNVDVDFTKQILSWDRACIRRSQLQGVPSLMDRCHRDVNEYYEAFIPFILEEARVILEQGLSLKEASKASHFRLDFMEDARIAKNMGNPSSAKVAGRIPDSELIGGGALALLLESGGRPVSGRSSPHMMLAIATLQPENINQFVIKFVTKHFETGEELTDNLFKKGSYWHAYILGSLLRETRMHAVCQKKPSHFGFIDDLYQRRHEEPLDFDPLKLPLPEGVTAVLSTLNKGQSDAIRQYLATSGLSILEGPPGTGKTTTLNALLKIIATRKPKERVLVCAPSNKAVQVIANRYSSEHPDAPILVVGVEDKLDERLRPIFHQTYKDEILRRAVHIDKMFHTLRMANLLLSKQLNVKSRFSQTDKLLIEFEGWVRRFNFLAVESDEYLIEVKEAYERYKVELTALERSWQQHHSAFLSLEEEERSEFSLIRKYARSLRPLTSRISPRLSNNFDIRVLNSATIVFATLNVCGRGFFDDDAIRRFQHVIIDEAGQALEPETLIPFSLIRSRGNCLLAGDTKQLPATLNSKEAQQKKFTRSLMERLQGEYAVRIMRLSEQYRMHPAIREWPSQTYYDGALMDSPGIATRLSFIPGAHLRSKPWLQPWAFYDINGKEERVGSSWRNIHEVQFIVDLLNQLKSCGIDCQKDVGIITFYSGQVEALKRTITGPNAPMIHTVDGFQGGERAIIILSFVRANEKGGVGFLDDFRRLNVALTRAAHHIFLIGEQKTLIKAGGDLLSLVQHAQKAPETRLFAGQELQQAWKSKVTKQKEAKAPKLPQDSLASSSATSSVISQMAALSIESKKDDKDKGPKQIHNPIASTAGVGFFAGGGKKGKGPKQAPNPDAIVAAGTGSSAEGSNSKKNGKGKCPKQAHNPAMTAIGAGSFAGDGKKGKGPKQTLNPDVIAGEPSSVVEGDSKDSKSKRPKQKYNPRFSAASKDPKRELSDSTAAQKH